MALNSSGPISIGGSTAGQSINLELNRSATATSSLNEAALRTLAGIASGQISLSNFYGKSNYLGNYFSTSLGFSEPGLIRVLKIVGSYTEYLLLVRSNPSTTTYHIVKVDDFGNKIYEREISSGLFGSSLSDVCATYHTGNYEDVYATWFVNGYSSIYGTQVKTLRFVQYEPINNQVSNPASTSLTVNQMCLDVWDNTVGPYVPDRAQIYVGSQYILIVATKYIYTAPQSGVIIFYRINKSTKEFIKMGAFLNQTEVNTFVYPLERDFYVSRNNDDVYFKGGGGEPIFTFNLASMQSGTVSFTQLLTPGGLPFNSDATHEYALYTKITSNPSRTQECVIKFNKSTYAVTELVKIRDHYNGSLAKGTYAASPEERFNTGSISTNPQLNAGGSRSNALVNGPWGYPIVNNTLPAYTDDYGSVHNFIRFSDDYASITYSALLNIYLSGGTASNSALSIEGYGTEGYLGTIGRETNVFTTYKSMTALLGVHNTNVRVFDSMFTKISLESTANVTKTFSVTLSGTPRTVVFELVNGNANFLAGSVGVPSSFSTTTNTLFFNGSFAQGNPLDTPPNFTIQTSSVISFPTAVRVQL
jgi:hypothetical protein